MLNKVQVDIVANADCQNSLQSTHLGKYFKLHKSFICASTQNSINPCKVGHGFIKLANFWNLLSYMLGIWVKYLLSKLYALQIDGGSPLACKPVNVPTAVTSGQPCHVIGLSSWSVGCTNQQQLGVFADVMAVAPWMQQQMSSPEASLVEQSKSTFQNQ